MVSALDDKRLSLAAGINAQHHGLCLSIGAVNQHKIDDATIVLFDGPSFPDQLPSASRMARHQPLPARAQNWNVQH
jgi:hypothetical protein